MNRTDILSRIARAINAETYLEIGVRNPKANFLKVIAASPSLETAIGVDPVFAGPRVIGDTGAEAAIYPDTSDAFAAALVKATKGRKRLYIGVDKATRVKVPKTFDLIFVDGDHTFEGARADIEIAADLLAPGGVVVFHDCLPASDDEALPQKPANGKPWCGEVWRAWCAYLETGHDGYTIIPVDHGVGVVWHFDISEGETEPPTTWQALAEKYATGDPEARLDETLDKIAEARGADA